MSSQHWSVRAQAFCATIAWCCALNLLWLTFTLLGGVVLGVGPATVTACVAVRRRTCGESFKLGDFAATWRREFLRGTAVVGPVAVVTGVLVANYVFFSALGPPADTARLVTLVALVLAVGVGAYVAPMYAHYDLPLWSILPKATRFALARPVPTVLLLFVFAALAFATATAPVLLFTVSIGGWLQTSTWLCLRFFAENEDRLASDAATPHSLADRTLPTEPLRIR